MVGALVLAILTYIIITILLGVGNWLWVGVLIYSAVASLHFPEFKHRKSWNRSAVLFVLLLVLQIAFVVIANGSELRLSLLPDSHGEGGDEKGVRHRCFVEQRDALYEARVLSTSEARSPRGRVELKLVEAGIAKNGQQ